MNQEIPTNGFTYFIWHNKIFLSIAMLIVMASAIFFPGVGALISFFVVFASILIAFNLKSFSSIGLKAPDSWAKTVLLGLLLGFGIELTYQIFINHLIELITHEPVDLTSLDPIRGNLISSSMMLLIGWVVGGFLEEVTFRGYLITKLREVFGDNPTKTCLYVLISAIPFGLAHMYQGWSGVLSTGSIGLVIAIIYVRSKSNLWLAVFTHGFTNTMGITLLYTNWDHYFLNLWK